MKIQKIVMWVIGLGIIIGIGMMIFGASSKKVIAPVVVDNTTGSIEVPPSQAGNGEVVPSDFSKTISFKLNDKFTFTDGLEVTLKEINDSRCPKGVQCFWAGEIAGLFSLSGGVLTAPKEIRVGTVNNKSVTWEGYTLTLQNATEDNVDIEIVKN